MADDVAPIYGVPSGRIVAVEHPAIIRNFENGLRSFGGEAQLKHVLEHHVGDSKFSSKQDQLPEPVAGVSLRPNDPLAKKIPSTGIETRNVLVRVTLPKRTGRKRKRGSDDPNTEPDRPVEPDNSITAPSLLRRLRDNESRYSIEPVGLLRETHRFRMLPDFQLRNDEIPIMRELRDHAMVPDYERLKNFRIDLTHPASAITTHPGPPSFASSDTPYKYEYQQAASVVFIQDEATGAIVSKNTSAPRKLHIWGLPPDVDEIPTQSPVQRPKPGANTNVLLKTIDELQKILDNRPLVTKRVALNAMPPVSDTTFKEATQYVGYSFKSGPWRDTLIKYGVDPRKDPKYRFYQTMMFQVDKEAFKPENMAARGENNTPVKNANPSSWSRSYRHQKDDPKTHIFDGKNITANGKTWQICDYTDPILHKIFHTENIRTRCDVYQWGWFWNGTVAKARCIIKDKMRFLFAGKTPPEQDYIPLADHLLEKFTRENWHEAAYLDQRVHGYRASRLAMDVRNIVKVPWGPSGRWGLEVGDDGEVVDQGMPDAKEEIDEEIDPELRDIDVGDMDDDDGIGDFDNVEPVADRAEIEEGQATGGAENE